MRTSVRIWALLVVLVTAGVAHGDPKADLQRQTKAAMQSYDNMEYETASKTLTEAIAAAKKAKLGKDPALAKAYLSLGIIVSVDGDQDAIRQAFTSAVEIDPEIEIDPAYRSADLAKLLDEVRKTAGGGGDGGGECDISGIQHDIVETGRAGADQPIEILVGPDVDAARAAVLYRVEGTAKFVEAKLTKQGGCKYVGAIPASAMKGSLIHYYVAVYDTEDDLVASKGSKEAPNILELTAGGDVENPIGGGTTGGGGVTGGVLAGKNQPKVFLAVSGGTGFGYVTGLTEANNEVQNCCLGNSLVVLWPELGYQINPQLSIGIAGRIGLPIGANVDPPMAKHSTIAPGAVIRIRYAMSHTGEGLRIMGQIGGGVMRNTIKLEMQAGGGDTDIVAQGPLLFGAGIGFKKSLSNSVAFVADLSALAGIAVIDKLGTAKLNSGVGGDVTIGLAVGF